MGGYSLSAAEERCLARRVHGSDKADAIAARNQLVLANIGLVKIILNRMSNLERMSDYDDAVSEGVLALFHAAAHYNPDRSDVKFGSYARVAIHRAMRRYLLDFYRLPCARLVDVVDPDSPPDIVMQHQEQVERLIARVQKLQPMQLYILAQRVELSDSNMHQEQVDLLTKRLQKLQPIQLYILAQRLQQSDGEERTFAAIADELKLPLARVRHLYRRACDRLKHPA